MVEIVATIVVLGTMAALAVPRYNNYVENRRVDAAAKRLGADIEMTQRHARLASASRSITFDLDTGIYTVTGLTTLHGGSGAYVVDLSQAPYLATVGENPFGGSGQLTFDGYGTPAAGGDVVLQVGRAVRRVSVNAASGLVTITTEAVADVVP
jgi:type II secretory pathway pseudopilin PulG